MAGHADIPHRVAISAGWQMALATSPLRDYRPTHWSFPRTDVGSRCSQSVGDVILHQWTYFLAALKSGTLVRWNAQQWHQDHQLQLEAKDPLQVAITDDGRIAVVSWIGSGFSTDIAAVELESGAIRWRRTALPGAVVGLQVRKAGQELLAMMSNGGGHTWSLQTGDVIAESVSESKPWIDWVAFPLPGSNVAMHGRLNPRICALADAQFGNPRMACAWFLRCGRVAPGGTVGATTSFDGTVKLWDLRNGTLVGTLVFEGDDWTVVSPDGRFDSSNLWQNGAVSWVFEDEPMAAYGLEAFALNYWTPNLLKLLVAPMSVADASAFAASAEVSLAVPTPAAGANP